MNRPRVLYLVTEPWYFANHRLDHAKALIDAGFEVHVATRRGDRWEDVIDAGCSIHDIDLGRGAGSIEAWLRELVALRRIVRRVRPQVVHAVALKPVALAISLAAMWRRPSIVLSVNGLGITATEGGRRASTIQAVIRLASKLPRVFLLFQTHADQKSVAGDRRGDVIPGVGVDTDTFVPGDRSVPPPFVVVYLGRAVASKGLMDLVDALGAGPVPGVELHLYCSIDPASPGSLSETELDRLRNTAGLTLHPPTRSPQRVLSSAHAAILPSRAGEGVSKFVLEALATGTPVLISTDSGSGEVIDEGRTGLRFATGDPAAIRAVLIAAANWSQDRWVAMSQQSRSAAEERFGLDVILPAIVSVHQRAYEAAP